MRVLVTGGTGRLGRVLLERADPAEFAFRVLSRRPAPNGTRHQWAVGDLTSGTGLALAAAGVDAVLHLASNPSRPADDVDAARHLLNAAAQAGVPHLLFVSIIGVDRVPYPLYQSKVETERVVAAGPVPWSILRAAQFHCFIDELLRGAGGVPLVMPLPSGVRVQPVAESDVADRVLAALRAGPGQRLHDYAGPEILPVRAVAREWKRARRIHKPIVPLPFPGRVFAALRAGHNINPRAERGGITWAAWLAGAGQVALR